VAFAREHRQRRLDVRDCHFSIVGLLTAQALAKGIGEIVLCRRPAVGILIPRDDGQRRLEAPDRLFHVLGAVSLNPAPVDNGEVVLKLAP